MAVTKYEVSIKNNLIIKSNLKKRALATFIDYLLMFMLCLLYLEYFGVETPEGTKKVEGVMALPVITAWFIYFVVIESLYNGTLGHLAFNLRVLNEDYADASFIQVLKRHLLDPMDFFIYGIPAFIAIKNTEKHQRLGDLWAKTIVVDIGDPEQYVKAYKK